MSNATPPLPAQFLKMVSGYWVAQAISAAARLGLADLVKDGPKTSEQLAQATGTQPRALYRLLRALASVGVFAEESNGRFALTPLAGCMLSDAPGSQRAMAIMNGEEHYRAWGELLYSLRTGKPAFDQIYGKPVFDYLAEHPEQGKLFDAAMTGVHGIESRAMLDAYNFSAFKTVVDVGGGNGSLLTEVLTRHPSLQGILFDRREVIERARANLKSAGLADRCQTMAGSFFESVPAGGDAYMLRHIIHDWDEERCRTILRNCRKAMAKSAKLLVIESVIPPGNEPSFGKLLDLTMLVIPGGEERTEAEYRELYAVSGFRLTKVVPTRADVCVIEGEPV